MRTPEGFCKQVFSRLFLTYFLLSIAGAKTFTDPKYAFYHMKALFSQKIHKNITSLWKKALSLPAYDTCNVNGILSNILQKQHVIFSSRVFHEKKILVLSASEELLQNPRQTNKSQRVRKERSGAIQRCINLKADIFVENCFFSRGES